VRFLFTVHPMYGHFHAMVPVARAVQQSGHEVGFATGKGFGAVVRHSGFLHFPCGIDFDGASDVTRAVPGWQRILSRVSGADGIQQLHGFIEGLAPRMADDLAPIASTWKPDLIVRDPIEYGGYVVAEQIGLPYATVIWGVYITPLSGVTDAFLELRHRHGLTDDAELEKYDQYLVLSFLPPSWTYPGSHVRQVTHRFQSPPFDRSGDERLPDWIDQLPDRPTVHVTLGTAFNDSPGTFQAIIEALETEGINVVVTVGRSVDPARFDAAPEHVRIARYIPQSLLLPHCEAIVFHGGYNSVLSALWHGLPMVITPQRGGDQMPNAERCAELGLGIVVEGSPPQPEALRSAVKSVLGDSEYRARARQLQQEMKELPELSEAVRRLEALARTGEPQIAGHSAAQVAVPGCRSSSST
jgi:UDP:flavonoid glycosyltransferase YjiC (YdhE family)